MNKKIVEIFIAVQGMTCANCKNRIESALGRTTGVLDVKAGYANARVSVTYDEQVIRRDNIESIIESLDYSVDND